MIIEKMQMPDSQIEKVKRLIIVMQEKGMTQKDMATLIGIRAPNLSAIIKNKENRELPYGTPYILEIELGVNRKWFDSGSGEKYINEIIAPSDEELVFHLKERLKEKDEIINMLKEKLATKSSENSPGISNRAVPGQLVTKRK